MKTLFTLFFSFILCIQLEARSMPTHTLTPVEKYDLQMLRWGGFAPVTTFHNQQDYHSILSTGRLTNGHLWPIPIVLALSEEEKTRSWKKKI